MENLYMGEEKARDSVTYHYLCYQWRNTSWLHRGQVPPISTRTAAIVSCLNSVLEH